MERRCEGSWRSGYGCRVTVYVDDMRRPARVGPVSSRWSHLLADSTVELNEFAARLGLRAAWIQHAGRRTEHYDLTDDKRDEALRLGAVPITYPGDVLNILRHKPRRS
jgi:hypothetical protein